MTIKKLKPFLAEFIYLFCIFFFCYTAINKLINIESFRTNLTKTSIFDIKEAFYFSYIVILVEFAVIAVLCIKKTIGLLIFCLVISVFTLYISYLRHNGLYEVCGCGGILNGLEYKYHIMINIGLIVGSLLSYYQNNYEK